MRSLHRKRFYKRCVLSLENGCVAPIEIEAAAIARKFLVIPRKIQQNRQKSDFYVPAKEWSGGQGRIYSSTSGCQGVPFADECRKSDQRHMKIIMYIYM